MIKEIKNTGGDWLMTNETLVNEVKSIDFTNL
jgi:hypothetical protein